MICCGGKSVRYWRLRSWSWGAAGIQHQVDSYSRRTYREVVYDISPDSREEMDMASLLSASFRKAAQFLTTKFAHHYKQINTGSHLVYRIHERLIINKVCTLLTIYFTKYNQYGSAPRADQTVNVNFHRILLVLRSENDLHEWVVNECGAGYENSSGSSCSFFTYVWILCPGQAARWSCFTHHNRINFFQSHWRV